MARDSFGSELKSGRNLDILMAAKKFFNTHGGLTVLSYEYTRDCMERPKKFIKRADLLTCSICCKDLYAFVPKVTAEDQVPESYVRQKQHLRFLDTAGKYHPTCYKLNQCFRSIEYDPSWAGTTSRVRAPSLEDFIRLAISLPVELESEIRLVYERVVLPFLIEWANNEITKQNVMRFVVELRELERVWLVFFSEDSASQLAAKTNILNHIGVRHD